jgi:hypothetical protein
MVFLRVSSILFFGVIGLAGCEGGAVQLSSLDEDFFVSADNNEEVPSNLIKDTFDGPEPQLLDLLFVVDNSCSMSEEQASLAAAAPGMYQALVDYGVDLHVGVVSTDMVDPEHSGRLQAVGETYFIDDMVANPEFVLSEMITMGTNGDYNERGRWAAYAAIELLGPTANHGFYREEAKLAVVVLSDEDDGSGICSQELRALGRLEFMEWMFSLKPTSEDVTFSSIVTPMNGCPGGYLPGYEYLEVTGTIGGVQWPICKPAYGEPLAELGTRMKVDASWFALSEEPEEESLRVFVEEEELSADEFSYVPRDQAVQIPRSTRFIRPSDTVTIQYRSASL